MPLTYYHHYHCYHNLTENNKVIQDNNSSYLESHAAAEHRFVQSEIDNEDQDKANNRGIMVTKAISRSFYLIVTSGDQYSYVKQQ